MKKKQRPAMHRRSSDNGLTLVELIAGMLLLTIILLMLYTMLAQGARTLAHRSARTAEVHYAEQVLQYYQNLPKQTLEDEKKYYERHEPGEQDETYCPQRPDLERGWHRCPAIVDNDFNRDENVCCVRFLKKQEIDEQRIGLPQDILDKHNDFYMIRLFTSSPTQSIQRDGWLGWKQP